MRLNFTTSHHTNATIPVVSPTETVSAPTKIATIPINDTTNIKVASNLLKSDLSQNLKQTLNSTTFRKTNHLSAAIGDDDNNNNTVLVSLSVLGIVLIVLGMCCLLCYREITRRRLENGILMEKARREMLRNAIKSKVEEMKNQEDNDDTESYMAVMELKVPLVTFGKVTMISPVPSTESMQSVLDRHLHHHHHHHHHHYHKLNKIGGFKD